MAVLTSIHHASVSHKLLETASPQSLTHAHLQSVRLCLTAVIQELLSLVKVAQVVVGLRNAAGDPGTVRQVRCNGLSGLGVNALQIPSTQVFRLIYQPQLTTHLEALQGVGVVVQCEAQ